MSRETSTLLVFVATSTFSAVGAAAALYGFGSVLRGTSNGLVFLVLGIALPLIASISAATTLAIRGRSGAAIAVVGSYFAGGALGAVAVFVNVFGGIGLP